MTLKLRRELIEVTFWPQNCGKFINIMIIAVIDGVDTSSMTRDQLEKFAHNLKNEVEKEREERNYFERERDELRNFWEITKNQLGEWISGCLLQP